MPLKSVHLNNYKTHDTNTKKEQNLAKLCSASNFFPQTNRCSSRLTRENLDEQERQSSINKTVNKEQQRICPIYKYQLSRKPSLPHQCYSTMHHCSMIFKNNEKNYNALSHSIENPPKVSTSPKAVVHKCPRGLILPHQCLTISPCYHKNNKDKRRLAESPTQRAYSPRKHNIT